MRASVVKEHVPSTFRNESKRDVDDAHSTHRIRKIKRNLCATVIITNRRIRPFDCYTTALQKVSSREKVGRSDLRSPLPICHTFRFLVGFGLFVFGDDP